MQNAFYRRVGSSRAARIVFAVALLLLSAGLLSSLSGSRAAHAADPNAQADFTIGANVINHAPPRFGTNIDFHEPSYIQSNSWISDSGFEPTILRWTDFASGGGSTFIQGGGNLTGSVTDGFFNGATVRDYRVINGVYTLIRTSKVVKYVAPANGNPDVITLDANGPTVQAGDQYFFDFSAPNLPAGTQGGDTWFPTISSTDPNFSQFSYQRDPTTAAPVDGGQSSMKVSTTATQNVGIQQYSLGPGDQWYEQGHTYQLSVWLKAASVADSQVEFQILWAHVDHIFTVTSQWQQYTFTFPAPAPLPANSPTSAFFFTFNGPGTIWIDNAVLSDTSHAPFTVDPRVVQALTAYNPGTLRIWSGQVNEGSGTTLNEWISPEVDTGNQYHFYGGFKELNSLLHLPTALALAKTIGADPWLIVSVSFNEQEWANLYDYLAGPTSTPYGAMRAAAGHPAPWTDDFKNLYIEVGNETWNGTFGPWTFNDGTTYGQFAQHMLSQFSASEAKNPVPGMRKIQFVANGFVLSTDPNGYGQSAIKQEPLASYMDTTNYVDTFRTDYVQASDLQQRFQNTLLTSQLHRPVIDAQVASRNALAAQGHPYTLASYEGGPDYGGDFSVAEPIGYSLAAGIATLDTYLYDNSVGYGPQNYHLFGTGPDWSSHTGFNNGFRPLPAWEALQLRNTYAHGDMVQVTTNSVPTTDWPSLSGLYPALTGAPLIGTYAFQQGNDYSIVVISRKLSSATPVTLHLPGSTGNKVTAHILTGDPTATNTNALNIAPETLQITNFAPDYTFQMPASSVYIFNVHVTLAPPVVPTGVTAKAGIQQVSLSWDGSSGTSHYIVQRSKNATGPFNTVKTVYAPSFVDTGLHNGTTYYYQVFAVNSSGTSAPSAVVSATPEPFPVAPTGLTASPGDAQVSLGWSAVTGANGYDVLRGAASGGPYTTVATNVSGTSFVDKGLTNGTTYYYVVAAVNQYGAGDYSAEASGKPSAAASSDAAIALAATPPVIDGNANDAIWSSAKSYPLGHTTGNITGPADFSGSFQSAWDANNLYFLVKITDAAVSTSTDNVEIYLDTNNSKPTSYGPGDYQYVFAWGSTTVQQYSGGQPGSNTAGIQFAQVATASGYQVEVKIPWSTLGITPGTTSAIGLDVDGTDQDTAGTTDGKIFWNATSDNDWQNPSLFGVGRLQ